MLLLHFSQGFLSISGAFRAVGSGIQKNPITLNVK
jgi:hypothetical protein